MTRWIVGSSLHFRLLVVAIAAVVMIVGVTQLRNAPMNVLPEFDAPYVEVQTEALGLSAAEVEQLITVPLEADLLNGVAWLKAIRSESMPGLSSVVLEFEPGTDIMRARQVVQERLTQAHALPNVSKAPTMLQPLSSTARVMNVGLKSDAMSLIDLSVLARWTIKPRLMGVPGVAHVSIWGQRKRQLQVHVDPERLQEHDLTLNQIVETAGNALWISPLSWLNASYPGTGGFIETPNQRLSIRHVLPIKTQDDLAKVAIARGKGRILSDVANVVESHPPLIGDALVDDGTGLLLVVEKFPWANTVEVTRGVEKAMASLHGGLGGVEVDTKIFRPATYLETAAANLNKAWLFGLVLGFVALALLSMEWRTAVISIVSIPAAVVTASLVLYFREGSFNAMSLAGLALALGIIVDDAVVDTRYILLRLRQSRASGDDAGVLRVILDASHDMRSALVFGTLIVLLVAVPAFALFGFTGAMVQPVAVSYVLAVLASMLVALTLTPALALYLFKNGAEPGGDGPLLKALGGAFDGLTAAGTRTPAAALGVLVVLGVVGLAILPTLDRDKLVPDFKATDLLIRAHGAPGTGPAAMTRVVNMANNELRAVPGVRNVGAHVGRAVLSDEVVNVNESEIWVSVDPTTGYQETLDAIQAVIDGYPGLDLVLGTYSSEKIEEALHGSDRDVVVRVYGEEPATLVEQAERVRKSMTGVDGLTDVVLESKVLEPIIHVEADLDACERHGIKPGDIRRASAILLSGIEVGMLFDEQKVFDVVVWGTPKMRRSITDVEELLIDTPGGGHVRLADVANVFVTSAPKVIHREGVNRYVDVYASVQGRSIPEAAQDVEDVLETMSFPLEFHASLVLDSEELAEAQTRTRNLAIACAILALLLLQAAFGSWRLGFLACLALPMALSGGLLVARFTGGALTIASLAGLVTVLALAVRQTIVTFHVIQLARRDGEEFSAALVRDSMRRRFGSILTSLVVTAALMLPLLFFGNEAGLELLSPMAAVILGGLVTTGLMSLYVAPAIYMQFGRQAAPEWDSHEDVEADDSEGLQYAKG